MIRRILALACLAAGTVGCWPSPTLPPCIGRHCAPTSDEPIILHGAP